MGEYIEVNLNHYKYLTDSNEKDIRTLEKDHKIAILKDEKNKERLMIIPQAHINLITEEVLKAKMRLEIEKKSVLKMRKRLLKISHVLKQWVKDWEQFQYHENEIQERKNGDNNDRNNRG